MKQSEDMLKLRLDLNSRERELRRAADASTMAPRPVQRERERSEQPRLSAGDQSPRRSDVHSPPS